MSECNSGYDARPQRPATRLRLFRGEPGRRALRTQRGFTRSNDAGGEINGSDSGARDASGCDSGAVHPIKLATTRTPMQTIFTNTLLTVASVAAWV